MRIVEIETNDGACDKCENHSGHTVWIPDESKITDVIDKEDLPPFHPNCKCKIIENIDGQKQKLLSKKETELLILELDITYHEYKSKFEHFGFAADAYWWFGLSKMCNERATELQEIFEQKLKDYNDSSVFVHFKHQYFPYPHAWIEVEFKFMDNNGRYCEIMRRYDAWKKNAIPRNVH